MTQALYAAATDLRDSTGNVELSQVATPENVTPLLDPTQLDTAINNAGVGATGNYLLAYNEIMSAISRASSVIDSRLRRRYTLPLAVVPSILTDYCVAISRFDLHRDQATDEIRYRYERALKDLDAVANDTLDVGAVGANNTGNTLAGFGIMTSAPTRDNTYDTLSGFGSVGPLSGIGYPAGYGVGH